MRAPVLRSLLLASTALSPLTALADSAMLPTGGQVAHGKVGIATPGAGQMTIDQGSQAAIVNWNGFSIGAQARVDVRQPGADAMLLNRVTGSTTSRIDGQLNANGQVFLLNPNGITIGPDGQVRAAGFVASSLGMSDEDFLSGRHRFEGSGSSAAVRNHGTVDIVPGGYAALLGGRVENAGTLRVPMGRVGLGSGERATLDFSGDGFLQVALPSQVGGDEALVSNSGRIESEGGRVEMLAASAREAVRSTVNMSGVIEARSVSGRNGAIVLGGGAGGRVQVSGRASTRAAPATLVASSPIPPARPTGGTITVTGAEIVLAGAELDASGPAGGGDIRIGGDLRGAGDLPRARTLAVDPDTVIRADALEAGGGGTVVLWSEDHTVFRGEISSRGGPEGGDGGFVEVSGKARLNFAGLVDRRAPMGRAGTLLLDPYDFVITDTAPSDGGFDGEFFFPDGTPSNIFVGDLVENLGFGDTIISTGSSDDDVPGEGTITVLAPIQWGGDALLTFDALGDIRIDATITAPTGGFAIDSAGTVTTGPDGVIDVARFTLERGNWQQVGADIPAFAARDFQLFPDTATFLRVLGGDGTVGSPWLLTDIYGLQGITTLLEGNFALANEIAAAPAATWNFDEGFEPIGFVGQALVLDPDGVDVIDTIAIHSPFTGSLDGRGFAIRDLTIAGEHFLVPVGLFAENAGDIENLRFLAPTIRGGTAPTGILAGVNSESAEIWNVVVEGGNVRGDGIAIGGLVGVNSGFIGAARVEVDLLGGGQANERGAVDIGGLVGTNTGDIYASRASGTVQNTGIEETGGSERLEVGGLVGANFGLIEESRADVDIAIGARLDGSFARTGRADTGGLVGRNHSGGDLVIVAATGDVRSISDTGAAVGGLVGTNDGDIWAAYATGDVRGSATQGGFTFVGGLVGLHFGTIDQGLATGAVSADPGFLPGGTPVSVGGLIGDNDVGTEGITASFWDTVATGQSLADGGGFSFPGARGLTTDELQDTAGFRALAEAEGWLFESGFELIGDGPLGIGWDGVWSPPEPGFYPQLYAIDPVVLIVPEGGSSVYGDALTDPPFEITGGPFNPMYVFGPEFFAPHDAVDVQIAFVPPPITVGTHPIGVSSVRSVMDDGTVQDYRVVVAPADIVITPAPLVITADNRAKIYGQALDLGTTAFSAQGLLFEDTVASVVLQSAGAVADAPVAGSPYAIIASEAAGAGLENYAITYVPGALDVLPLARLLQVGDGSKVYGTEFDLATIGVSHEPLLFDDAITAITLESDGAAATATVAGGPYAITASDIDGDGLGNYTFTVEPGTLTVTPAPLIITADDRQKIFGEELVLGTTAFTATGLRNDDIVDAVALFSEGASADAPLAGSPYPIVASDPEGTGLGNYEISFVDGELVVLPREDETPALPQEPTIIPPNFIPTLPSPPGTFVNLDLPDHSTAPTPVAGAQSQAVAEAQQVLALMQAMAQELELAAQACRQETPLGTELLDCIANALGSYASALEDITLDLPPELAQVSAVIRQAQAGVQDVRTRAEARMAAAATDAERREIERQAVEEAIGVVAGAAGEVRRAIELIRADDPQLVSIFGDQGATVVQALESVQIELVRAIGI